MSQNYTVLLDLDGTLVDTAPDLMMAHNHVMKKFGYESKTTEEIRNLVGKGAGVLIGRSIWGSAKKEFSKITDQKIKDEMVKEFIDYYGKNIVVESKLLNGVLDFLEWCKSSGNDLITPHPEFGFPGLKDGDNWCVCASWVARAIDAGKGCSIYLKKTHENTLKLVPIEKLKKYAIDLS